MTEIEVEVVYVTPEVQEALSLTLPEGSTIQDAVTESQLKTKYPSVDFDSLKKGIWYAVRSDDTVLQSGDRVEIYRPLITDAKTARRQRAQLKQKKEEGRKG